MLLYFIYFLNSQWEGEKASTYAFWHINSSQWRERGSQWFQTQNQDRLFWQAPNYRVLQAQIETISEKFYFPTQFRKRESQAKKTTFHKLIWFQQPLGVGTQSDNNPSFRPCPSCQLASCRDWKSIAATWSFHVAQRQRKLLTPAGQNDTDRIAESSRSSHSMAGLNFAVHVAGSLLTALRCLKTCYHLLKLFTEHPTHAPSFTKHKQLLGTCCVLTHWVYSPSKPQTVLFRVDTCNCCVSWAVHLALF